MWYNVSSYYAPLQGVNLVVPLHRDDRCLGRFHQLDAALRACDDEPSCTGVVDDGGMWCGNEVLEFELRTGKETVTLTGVETWVRAPWWWWWQDWWVSGGVGVVVGYALGKVRRRKYALHVPSPMSDLV